MKILIATAATPAKSLTYFNLTRLDSHTLHSHKIHMFGSENSAKLTDLKLKDNPKRWKFPFSSSLAWHLTLSHFWCFAASCHVR